MPLAKIWLMRIVRPNERNADRHIMLFFPLSLNFQADTYDYRLSAKDLFSHSSRLHIILSQRHFDTS